MDEQRVQAWLDAYVRAWESYDEAAIGDLFAEGATYAAGPFEEPIVGREAIVAAWLEDPDEPGTFRARYEPLVVAGDTAMAAGYTAYGEDPDDPDEEYANAFFLRFDPDGRCVEYREWWMPREDEDEDDDDDDEDDDDDDEDEDDDGSDDAPEDVTPPAAGAGGDDAPRPPA